MNSKPLPGRHTIIITRQANWKHEGVIVANNIENAIKKAEAFNCLEAFIAGGGEIFRQSMNIAHRIYMTRVQVEIDGDTFFPEIPKAEWELKRKTDFKKDEKHLYDFSIEVWERK